MGAIDPRSDEELLAATAGEPTAFGVFYHRHVADLLGFLMRRTRDPELAADLCAEVFAAALEGVRRFRPERGAAIAWLYGIAHRKLADAYRRGAVEDRARRRLRMEPLVLDDEALERVEALADATASSVRLRELVDRLPPDQRDALRARVIDERDYGEIAGRVRCSESVIRKRVSRALAGLRADLEAT